MLRNKGEHVFETNGLTLYNLRPSAVVENIEMKFSRYSFCWCTWARLFLCKDGTWHCPELDRQQVLLQTALEALTLIWKKWDIHSQFPLNLAIVSCGSLLWITPTMPVRHFHLCFFCNKKQSKIKPVLSVFT